MNYHKWTEDWAKKSYMKIRVDVLMSLALLFKKLDVNRTTLIFIQEKYNIGILNE